MRTQHGRLCFTLPALPPEADANAPTRHAVLLLDRHGVPSLPTPEQFDVAGAAHILAELCGVAFELGKKPPDLQFEPANLSLPLAAWFDRASRRGDAPPFTDARDALLALEQAIGHQPGLTTAAQKLGAGHRPATFSEAATAVSAPLVVQLPPTPRRQMPTADHGMADRPETTAPMAAIPVSSPLAPDRAAPSRGLGLLAAFLVVIGIAAGAWWWMTSNRQAGNGTSVRAGPAALSAAAVAEGPTPESSPRAWDAIAGVLPNGNVVEEWRHQRGVAAIRDLFSSAQQGDVKPSCDTSDVRSGLNICRFSTIILGKPHSVTAEFDDGKLRRLGNPSLPTAAGREVQSRLPALDNSQSWALGCGGSVEWRQVDGAWLHLYAPPGEGNWEWWIYGDLPPAAGTERQILEAYSCNDAGVQAWKEGNSEEALRLLRKATTLTPNYGWAAARGCKAAVYLGVEGADLCTIAGQSNFKGARGCVSAASSPEPPPAKLCGH